MKKLFSIALLSIIISGSACAKNEKVITKEELPEKALSFINTYFSQKEISFVLSEQEGLTIEYEVRFANGAKAEFDKNGELDKIDCNTQAVPEGVVPQAVKDYVKAKFPKDKITEWGKDDRRWKAELTNGLELIFDKNYKFIKIDD